VQSETGKNNCGKGVEVIGLKVRERMNIKETLLP